MKHAGLFNRDNNSQGESRMTSSVTTQAAVTPVKPDEFREGMAALAAAVNVITTQSSDGPFGFTATAVCSVSDQPATLMICLNRTASVYDSFNNAESLAVNTLAQGQEKISNVFGGKAPMSERFAQGQWQTLRTGSPILADAAVSFDCIIRQRQAVATHDVMFCEVLSLQINANPTALLYYQRHYESLGS